MAFYSLLLLACVAGTLAGPISYSSETCATTCEGRRHGYETGKTYEYDLETTVQTSIPGTTEDVSSLRLTAKARIEALSECDLALRLEDVLLDEAEPGRAQDFKRGLEGNTLVFALSNGKVTDVCPSANEATWALNIKRAVLSSLQNTMDDFQTPTTRTETDVVGVCPVMYEPTGSTWSSYSITKTKDILACTQPTYANTVFQAMHYKVPSKVQSLPLLKSTHECQQEVATNGKITKSVCEENHIFRPFSRDNSGATTVVRQSLIFKSESSGTRSGVSVARRTELVFEHIPTEEVQDGTQREVMATMQQICEVTKNGIRPEVPGLFGDLVKGMRRLDFNTLTNIGRRANRLCDKAQAFFRDAVPTLGTSASVGLMREMIKEGQASESEADLWLTSLAFLPKPDTETLREVKPLLEIATIRRKSYLAVSTMVNSYCRQNTECEREPAVRNIIDFFRSQLGRDCSGDREPVLMALKALGNTGHGGQVIPILNTCMANEAASIEIRVAAINAMRRMDCNADTRTLLDILQSTFADSELRINAYLALMRCPTENTLSIVKRILEGEQINQVGSFIWTHLTNLQETNSPLKQEVKAILANEKLKNEFDLDKRKFSRNIEWSAFNDAINTGAALESNLIWSSQSFVPRSAMVNLTVDLFGHSVNLVELGGRVQGLDAILENMFADAPESQETSSNRINNFDGSFSTGKTDPQGSYYIRVFGNEIRYEDFVGFDTQSIKDKLNYLQWLIELAKEHDFDFTKSMLFMESELKFPTVAGLPLVLSVDGTATMDLKIRGKIDLRDLASSPRAFDITGTVRPTAAIQINGKMGVDAFVASTGLKTAYTFYTSTLADGSITLKDGKIFNLDINLPDERQEIFNAQSKFYITHRGADREQAMTSEGRFEAHRCVSDTLVSALGVEVCADLSLPRLTRPGGPLFPLTGPVSASISLNKRDSLSKYHMEARVVRGEVSKGITNHEMVFSFNTPGSRYDREFTANFILNNADKAVRLDLRSPWKRIDITGSMVNNAEMKRLAGQITIDNKPYSVVSQLEINEGKYATRYTPLIEVSLFERVPYKLHGSVIYREGKKADVEINIDNVFEEQATFKGLVRKISKNDQTRVESDIAVDVMSFKGKMLGFLDSTQTKDEVKVDTELTIKYRTSGGPQSISLNNNFLMQTPRGRNALTMTGSVTSSLYRRYDSDYSLQVFAEGQEAGLSLNMGLTKDKPSRIAIDLQGKYDIARNYRNGLVQGLARLAAFEDVWETKLDHSHSPNELQLTWTGRKNSDEAVAKIALKRQGRDILDVAVDASLTYPGHQMSYVHTLVQTSNIFNHDLTVNVDREDKFKLISVYKAGRRHEMTADLKVHGFSPVYIESSVQPDALNFAADAKLSYGSKVYSSNMEWQHNGNARNFNNKANWKLDVNGDKVGIESEVSIENRNNVKFNIQGNWDINNRGLKKVGVTGTCIVSKTTPSLQANVRMWPENFHVGADISLKLDDNDFWSRNRDLEGTIRLVSTRFDDINAAFKHERRPDTVKTSGEVEWSPGKKIDGLFSLTKINGYSNANVNFILNTPYTIARRVATEATYNLQGNKMTANGRADLDGQVINFETTASIELPNIDVSITGNTPFNGYESFSIIGKHTSAGRNCQTEVKIDMGARQLIALEYNMDHERNGYFITNSGSLSLNMPVRGYRTNKLTWNHRNTLRDIDSRMVLEIENDKSIFDIEAKNRRIFMTKANIISPYIPNIRLKIEHQGDRREYIYKSTGTLQYGRDTYAFDNDLSLLDNSFTLKTKVNTPFRNWEEMLLDLSNVREGNVIRANNIFSSGSGLRYEVSGTFVNNGMPAMTTELKLVCSSYGEVLIEGAIAKEMNIWVSSLNVAYPGNKKINVITKLGLDDLKKLSVDITTPYSAIGEVSMDVEHRGEPKKCDTSFKFSHNKIRGRIEGDLSIDMSDINDIKIKLDGRTPFEGVTTVRSIFSHKKSAQTYQTDFSFEIPINKFTASNMMRIESQKVFSTVTAVEYATGKRVELKLNSNVEDSIAIEGEFLSPWTGKQRVSLTHQGSWKNFQTSIAISPRQNEIIDSRVEFTLEGSTINALAKITSPYKEFRILEVTLNHQGEITSFSTSAMLNYNDKRMTAVLNHRGPWNNLETTLNISPKQNENIESKIQFVLRRDGMNALAKIMTPYENIKLFEVILGHRGELESFNSELMVNYNERKMTASLNHQGSWRNFETSINLSPKQYENIESKIQFAIRGNNVNAMAKVLTPYENARILEITLNHRGEITSFNSNAMITFNERKMTASLNHQGPWNNFETTLNLSPKQDENIESKIQFALQRDSINAMAKIATPFECFRILEVTLNHRGEITSFNSNAMITFNERKMTATLNHQGPWNNFETTLTISPKQNENIEGKLQFALRRDSIIALAKITTPYEKLTILEVTLNHRGEISSFNSNVMINYNEGKMEAVLNHQGPWNNFETTLNVSPRQNENIEGKIEFSIRRGRINALARFGTPYEKLRLFEVNFVHQGEMTSFNSDLSVNYNNKKITGNIKFDLDNQGVKGETRINTPFDGYKTMDFTFSHVGDLTMFNSKYVMSCEEKKIELTMDYNYNNRGVTGRFELATPFEQLRNAGINFEHNGYLTNFRNSGNLQYNGKTYSGDSSFEFSNNNLKASAVIRTPEEYSLEVNHNGDAMAFSNDATLRINGKVYSGRSGFKMVGNNMEISAMAESPYNGYRNMGITFTHRGDGNDFDCDLVMKLEDKSMTAKQTFKISEGSMEHTISIQTPFQGFSSIGYSLSGQTSANTISSELTLSKEEDRIAIRNNFRVTQNKVSSSISITTPFRKLREASLNLFHDGDSKNFNNEIVGSWNRQTMTGRSAFAMSQSSIETTVSIETPFDGFSRASAEFKHTGALKNFNNELILSLENRSIKNTNTFSLEDNSLNANIKLETPFDGFRISSLDVRHSGPVSNFNNEITMTLDNNSIKNTNAFAVTNGRIAADFKIETPFQEVRLMQIQLIHSGRLTRFNNELALIFNNKEIKSTNSFFMRSNSRIDGGFSIQTPFDGFRTMSAMIKHNGEPREFNCEYTLSLEEKTITLKNNFLLQGSKLECAATLETPFQGYSRISFDLKHNGPYNDWNNELSGKIEGTGIVASSSFKMSGSKADFSATLTTPFAVVRDISLTIDHDGPITNFRNEGILSYNGQRYQANSEFALRTEYLRLAASIKIPETYGFTLVHEGPWTGFNNNLVLTIAGNPHTATSSFKYDDKIEGNLNVDTPRFPVTLTFNHEGVRSNFKQGSSLNINGNEYSHNGVFSISGRKLESNFNVKTPHRWARSLSAKFDHQGKWNNFENMLALERNGAEIKIGSQLIATDKRVKGDITIKTPKEYSIVVIQKGAADDLTAIVKMTIDNQKSQANINYKNKNDVIEGGITIRTPYRGYRNMGADFSYKNKRVLNIAGSLKTPFDDFESFAFEVTHRGDLRAFTTSGKIETPFRQARVTQFELNHEGRLRNFAERAFIDVDQKRISGNLAFSNNNNGLQSSASIETPFEVFKTASGSLTHNGVLSDFTTQVNGEFNNKRIEGIATFKKDGNLLATLSLKTPFELRDAKLQLNHQGNLNDFTTTSDNIINGMEYKGRLNFKKRGTVIESSGSINTPFKDGSFRMNHRGNYNDFVTSGQVELGRRTIDGELVFKLQPEIMTTARLSTPWPALRQFNFNLNHRGSLLDFSTIASGELNDQRMNGNFAFKKEGNTLESSANIRTPFEQFPEFAYTLTHSMQSRNIRSTATLTLPCDVYKHFRGEFNVEGSLNNFRSNLKINTPFQSFPEGVLKINHRGELQEFSTTGTFEYSGEKIQAEVVAKNNYNQQQNVIKIFTPYNVLRSLNLEMDNQRQGSEMIGNAEAAYNGRKQFEAEYNINVADWSQAAIKMISPITVEFRGKNEYANKEMIFRVPGVIFLTSNFDKTSDSFTHSSRMEAGEGNNRVVSYKVEGSTITRGSQIIYDGRVTIDSSFGNFESTMSHKINGRRYMTDLQVQRLRVSSDIELQQAEPNMRTTLKMSHPSFPNENILFAVEGSYRDAYNGKINLEYADQKFEFVGKLADESPSSSNTKYVAEAHLTHPASYLDVQFTSQLTNNEEKMGGNMEVKYMMTRDRQLKANALRAEINKLKEELNMELNTPVKRVSMIGRRVEEKNGQHFTVEGNIDDRDMRADVQLNKDQPGFDINIQVDNNNQVFVSGKYAEPSSIQLEAYREEYGRRVRESEVSLSLNSDNLVNARAYLNPDFYNDLRRVLGVDLGLEQMVDDVVRAVREEWRYKSASLSRAFEPIRAAWNEMTAPIYRVFNNLYESNAFYIRTVVDVMQNWAIQASDYASQLQYRYRYQIRRLSRNMEAFYYRMTDGMQYAFDNYIMPATVASFKKTVEVAEYLRTHPTVTRFFDWLESMEFEKHYGNFRDYCMKLVKQYNAMLDKVKAYWVEFKEIPGMTYVIDYINKVVDGVRWVYDASELDELVQSWMRELRTHGLRAIRMWLQSKMDLVKAEYTRWEPEQGDYEVQVKMPVSWSEVTYIPDFGLSKYWEKLKATVAHVMPAVNFSFGNSWSFWDAFYTYKPSSNPREWIPPFDTHSAVAGSQHFMTFDKKFYEFAGECSYLLARDFLDGKFSVVINYENTNGVTTKKSISIHSGDKEIEILPDFKVNVDGKQSELPVVLDKTVIRRIGNLIQIDNEHGLNITCNLPHDHCSVHVTGWYYGKTGGLLGTYDNEPATDFQKSNRQHATSVEDFAKSWSLGRRCRANNQAVQVSLNSASSEYRMCARYFEEESSPFRLCYGQIKPEEFMTMCVNEVSRSNDNEAAVCRIASFYVDQCKLARVPVRMPRDCVKCSDNKGSPMQEGETITIENNDVPKMADVVFVVSHKSCNRDVLGRLGDIIDQIVRNFRQSGIRDVRFGLVGYGLSGTLGGPHSHTFEGEIFNTGNKFTSGLSSFAITNEPTTEDSLTALHFAARYPFRLGASKSIVHMPCDSCQEQEVEYPDIQRLLLDRDIRLHLLLHHNFELRTSARKTAYIFGIDRDGLFTPRSVGDEELEGDKALRKQVYVPKDLCAALSQESDGSIFSITQLMEARTMVQKKFLDVFTRITAKKGAPTECQICECTADETGVGMSVCRSCTPSEPMNQSWFEYEEPSVSDEEEDNSPEQIKKPLTREEKKRRKEARRLRMLERRNKKKQ